MVQSAEEETRVPVRNGWFTAKSHLSMQARRRRFRPVPRRGKVKEGRADPGGVGVRRVPCLNGQGGAR